MQVYDSGYIQNISGKYDKKLLNTADRDFHEGIKDIKKSVGERQIFLDMYSFLIKKEIGYERLRTICIVILITYIIFSIMVIYVLFN